MLCSAHSSRALITPARKPLRSLIFRVIVTIEKRATKIWWKFNLKISVPETFYFLFFGFRFIYSLKLPDELKVGTSTINRDVYSRQYRIIVFYSRKWNLNQFFGLWKNEIEDFSFFLTPAANNSGTFIILQFPICNFASVAFVYFGFQMLD